MPKTWETYQSELREFDAVLEHAKAVSASIVGTKAPSHHASYGEQIYVKLLSHCIVLRRLAPDPRRRVASEVWDVPSVSAIARCVIEAHDAFEYVAGHSIDESEREFRIVLWQLHDNSRRIRMIEAIGSTNPKAADIRAAVDSLTAQLEGHSLFETLREDTKKSIKRGEPPAFHLSRKDRCAASRVNYEYHTAVTMQLSQHVHTHPFSIHQLFNYQAGTLDALHLMSLPLLFALPFMARTALGMATLFPGLTPFPPSRTLRTMTTWSVVSEYGVKAGRAQFGGL